MLKQLANPDLQHPLLRQDLDDGTHVLRDAAFVAQLGDVIAESDGGGFQGVAGTDSGACAPQHKTIGGGLGVRHGCPLPGGRMASHGDRTAV
jgi:hypothetical protein